MNLKPFHTVIAAVITMLALGSIYAWSIFVPRLITEYGYSTGQTQLIFGVFIGVFTVAMVFGRSLLTTWGASKLAFAAAVLYTSGYVLIWLWGPGFLIMFGGLSLLAGTATGFGYLISISVPVEWFPEKKGLITGIVSAGFGGGAILESIVVQKLFIANVALLDVFLIVGIGKGILLLISSFFFIRPENVKKFTSLIPLRQLIRDNNFLRLFAGIFTGTFAGLLVVGNLKPIGEQYPIDETTLVLGITVFSIANFSGRLFWGWINDYVTGYTLIPLSLFLMGIFILFIAIVPLSSFLYLFISFAVGFSFGANFVIYAKETAQIFGLENLGKIYPFIFLGYGISGIAGPFTGGWLRDLSGSYQNPAFVAAALCLIVFVGMLFVTKPKTVPGKS